MPFPRKLRILVAPLDWGLGHTTRCIPVIKALLQHDAEVIIAGNEVQEKVLTAEFPDCKFLFLGGYGVAYSNTRKGFVWKMMQQLPRISSAVQRENKWLQEVLIREPIDGVISDNRFGLYTSQVPCVFITHQLRIQTGLGKLADDIAQQVNYRYMNRFNQVWVPDFHGPQNLAGVLSHPPSMPPTKVSYVGPLTRMAHRSPVNDAGNILFIFSGPEPQRSLFEQKVIAQLGGVKQQVTIVRGKPLQEDPPLIKNAIIYNHLPGNEMESLMRSAALIVCRSGYSSVMDINALGQKSVLIPTPGQTEQEYLANYLEQNKFAVKGSQGNFDLQDLLQKAAGFCYDGFINHDDWLLTKVVAGFLDNCREELIRKKN
ncbi:glycosyltransferase [Niabella yanshanensis]|uniref:glycosyltransferase n=1 Tax=Niabella yanshanensis TaxID=577386 RepID=UPI000E0CB9D6|nr:glycosyltransferase [Niabella yanshanensis]